VTETQSPPPYIQLSLKYSELLKIEVKKIEVKNTQQKPALIHVQLPAYSGEGTYTQYSSGCQGILN